MDPLETIYSIDNLSWPGIEMKLVAFNGSPRKEGDTSRILKEIVKIADGKGYEVEYIDLADHDIGFCRGCMGCKRGDSCILEDDMQKMYGKIHEADVLVFGSPIYMCSETGLFKNFIDRLYALMAISEKEDRMYDSRLTPGKKAIIVYTCGTKDGNILYHYMNGKVAGLFSGMLGINDFNSQIVPGTLQLKDVLDTPYAKAFLETVKNDL